MRYEFLIREQLSGLTQQQFPELAVGAGPAGGTVLYGEVCDEAQLHGLLSRFATLGLLVVEMRQLPD